MNSNIGISIGWIYSCRTMRGRDSSFVKGLGECTKYIHLGYGVIFLRMPWKLVSLIQYVKFKKNGEVYFEIIN